MLGKDEERQSQCMFVNLDEIVPQDHLLRTIKQTIDFSFIYDKVKDLYSPVLRDIRHNCIALCSRRISERRKRLQTLPA